MRAMSLARRSLLYHWRTNLAVTIGAAVGTAAITGALLVGDSMRGSLRESAVGRLGRVDHALVGNRFFREQLADDLAASMNPPGETSVEIAPVILLRGGASHAETHARANRVNIIGVDGSFWHFQSDPAALHVPALAGRSIILNEPLAAELRAKTGDDILIRIGKPQTVSSETLLGRRDDMTATMRLTVRAVIGAVDIGAFSLNARQLQPYNAYIPIAAVQHAIEQRGRVNTLLVACRPPKVEACGSLSSWLGQQVQLSDLGLRLRRDAVRRYVALESDAMLIDPSVEAAALSVAARLHLSAEPSTTYLANSIEKASASSDSDGRHGIPYSTVTAIDPARTALVVESEDRASAKLQPGGLFLNRWAADDLDAKPGDQIAMTYFVTGAFGQLETRRETFDLLGIVAIKGDAGDPGWVPKYKGVTDTENLADWNPPFPMDFAAIRDKDELYWDEYRTTPKAFLTLDDAQRLWGEDAERFGRYTSVRLRSTAASNSVDELATAFERALLDEIDPAVLGLRFEPVRAQITAAAAGTTDFGGLFIGFSFFLIASAAMLVALLFRLGVERRAGEVGLLLSLGFAPRAVAKLLVAEGAIVAAIGGVAGIFASLGYASFMLAGLRSSWSQAVSTPFLRLHVSAQSITIGLVAGFSLAVVSIAWSVRGLARMSPQSLLAGRVAAGGASSDARRGPARWVALGSFAAAVAMIVLGETSEVMPQAITFFLSGAALLVSALAFLATRISAKRRGRVIQLPGVRAMIGLGVRNAMRHRGRSILTAGLIASATFLIAALAAFHVDAGANGRDRNSGSGGFVLFAESSVPLAFDLNSAHGREALNVSAEASESLGDVSVIPFRLRPGDESSCVNLYKPTNPRVIGATPAMIQRGGFSFSSTQAKTDAERQNPWLLLHRTFSDGAVPVIGDESAVKWQLHLGLGKDLVIQDDRGVDVRLRFVALLAGSVLQDELIVSETRFVTLFPSIDGHAFFLIDVPQNRAASVETALERELETFGFDVGTTTARLAAYLAVQNTYLSTFQMLGGFGLILGTVGLAAVMLRNVWERRGELALMRAVGFSKTAIACVVLSENAMLLVAGLIAGTISALVAVSPHLMARPSALPWLSLGLTLSAVLAVGLIAGVVAIIPTLRAPIIPSLRSE